MAKTISSAGLQEFLEEEAAESERFAEQLFNEREEFRKKLETTERERDELKTRVAVPAPEVKEPDPQDAKYTIDLRQEAAESLIELLKTPLNGGGK